jgi:hypothetical protein
LRIGDRTRAVVCIAPAGRLSRGAAAEIAAGLPGVSLTARSLSGYLDAPRDGNRILLCPAGRSLEDDLAFLRRTARRLLWPAPSPDFRAAIGGLRTRSAQPQAEAASRPLRRRGHGLAAALLLEGPVGPQRARAALASAAPRDWIVESPRHVRLSAELDRALERAGVRLSALEPVEVVALFASVALARAAGRWKSWFPPKTPVWIRGTERL